METACADDLYEVLDELNEQLEDIVSSYPESDLDQILPILTQKAQDFINGLQEEIEKLDLIAI